MVGNIMRVIEIIRLEESFHGTIGILKINKEVFCVTLEPPDLLNLVNSSSIPPQQYLVNPYTYHSNPAYLVTRVPGRSGILFHPGNVASDTAGCILLGSSIGNFKGNRAVLNSGTTFRKFVNIIGEDESFHLTITENY